MILRRKTVQLSPQELTTLHTQLNQEEFVRKQRMDSLEYSSYCLVPGPKNTKSNRIFPMFFSVEFFFTLFCVILIITQHFNI